MTPERKAWWDSLPTEEKRVRKHIKFLKERISWNKRDLKLSYGHQEQVLKMAIHNHKFLIKALRKQIAMRPYVMKTTIGDFEKCPTCNVRTIRYYPHCACCGQKLRWE